MPKPALYKWESLNAFIGAAILTFPLLDAAWTVCLSLPLFVSFRPAWASKVTP